MPPQRLARDLKTYGNSNIADNAIVQFGDRTSIVNIEAAYIRCEDELRLPKIELLKQRSLGGDLRLEPQVLPDQIRGKRPSIGAVLMDYPSQNAAKQEAFE